MGALEAVMSCLCSYPFPRLLGRVAFAAALAFLTAGCNTTYPTAGTLSIASAPQSDADWRRSAEAWSDRYRANPTDAEAAINYAQALRGMGQRAQAAAVLVDPEPKAYRSHGCLWPRACQQRQLPASVRRPQPHPYARPARLAHPVRAGRGARPDGEP